MPTGGRCAFPGLTPAFGHPSPSNCDGEGLVPVTATEYACLVKSPLSISAVLMEKGGGEASYRSTSFQLSGRFGAR
jgi:hypothetical protein